jgi:hypothetical protein
VEERVTDDRVSGGRTTGADAARNRRRFLAALGVFLVWVVVLGVLAVVSGHRPAARPAALESR